MWINNGNNGPTQQQQHHSFNDDGFDVFSFRQDEMQQQHSSGTLSSTPIINTNGVNGLSTSHTNNHNQLNHSSSQSVVNNLVSSLLLQPPSHMPITHDTLEPS